MTTASLRPAALGQPLSVLVPVRNYANGMRQFLDVWHKAVDAATHKQFDLIVIDDASTDDTAAIVADYALKAPDISLVRHDAPRGLGAALRSGFAVSRRPLVLIVVPEWSFRPTDLAPMMDAMNGADIVAPFRTSLARPTWLHRLDRVRQIAARYVLGIDFAEPAAWHGWPDFRRRQRLRWRFGLRMQDPTCGLRLVRRWVLERCPIQSDGSFSLIEMYAKANFAGTLVCEMGLSRAGTIPVMREPFVDRPSDERSVFRSPDFRPALVEMATTTLDTSARLPI